MVDVPQRQKWMAIFAKASLPSLEACISTLELPSFEFLRSPEIGLTMVRGRMGGTGQPFNLGEMPLTRCVIQMCPPEGTVVGFGYVVGRSHRHAELAAIGDALMQQPEWCEIMQSQVIDPLLADAQQRQIRQAKQVAATQVDFYTMRRGE